ncbi:MAG: adenylate/guanylate cyclase domain-containing protein [Nocardioidaceae bacterium]
MSERRLCSVLFCDLVGFTTLSESRDPEEIRELLSEYFVTARTIIGRYGGVVEKFIGDAVMAVWGTPTATEGDAERCVRAALDVVAAVAELGETSGASGLSARAGVVTGEVAVTLGATGEGMVAGDAVNTAARVQSAAAPGAVWVDGATHRSASSAIGFTDAGEHAMKGKAEPVNLWVAIRVLSGIGGAQRVDGLEAPLCGRDAELRTLKELFHASAERRAPRLVLVSGPAGVGKSRLGWEFEKYVDGLADVVWWHRGRCLSYGEGVAFWALAEIVRQRLAIAEEDPHEVAATKLEEGLATLIPDPADRTYLAPRLARLLGLKIKGDSEAPLAREELFAGWRVFFERLAAQGPVALLIENAQYADAGLLDFLDHLIDWARDAPIYVLVFTRPELDDIRPGFGTGRNRSALTIDPLDTAAMDAMVDAMVPGMPAEAREMITAQAQGIPLFAVETVRSLVDRDVVVPLEGVYRLVGDIGQLTIPDSLHGLLASRLDALDPHLRMLVADAAVLGSSFPAEALIAVSSQSEDEVRIGLGELLRREVLSVSADRLSPQVGDYRFAQDLLRQVAYETLSRRERKTRHLTVASHMRATFANDGDDLADVIARHYLDALTAVPDAPDVPEIRREAVGMLIRGADRAYRSGSPTAAAAGYAAAASETEHLDGDESQVSAAELYEKASTAAYIAADFAAAVTYADQAGALYGAQGRERDRARVQAAAGRALSPAGRHRESRERLEAALAVLSPEPDADTVSALGWLAGLASLSASDDADELTAQALELGQAVGVDRSRLGGLFIARGLAHVVADRYAQATASFSYATRLGEEAEDSTIRSSGLLNLANVLLPTDPVAAAGAARDATVQARKVGDANRLRVAISNLSQALIVSGNWDEADQVLREAVEVDGVHDDYVAMNVVYLAVFRGDRARARAAAAELASMRASEDPQDQAAVAGVEALLAVSLDDLPQVLAHSRTIMGTIQSLGVRNEVLQWLWPLAVRTADSLQDRTAREEFFAALDVHPTGHVPPVLRIERDLARARVRLETGDTAALDAMSAAVEALRQVGRPYPLAEGLLDHATGLARGGEREQAAVLLEEARQIADRLRAARLAARIRDALESDDVRVGSAGAGDTVH